MEQYRTTYSKAKSAIQELQTIWLKDYNKLEAKYRKEYNGLIDEYNELIKEHNECVVFHPDYDKKCNFKDEVKN